VRLKRFMGRRGLGVGSKDEGKSHGSFYGVSGMRCVQARVNDQH
jgi:hypothetical protein